MFMRTSIDFDSYGAFNKAKAFKEDRLMGTHKNQRGFAPVVIVLVVLVLAIAGGSYYFVTKANKDDKSGQSAEEKAASSAMLAACKEEVDDEDFCKYAEGSLNLFGNKVAYTAVTTGSAGGVNTTTTLKSDGKGNTQMITATPQGNSETIMLNGTTYTKGPGQSVWYRLPKSEDTAEDTSTDNTDIDEPEYDFENNSGPKSVYKKLGEEPCGNLTCIKYQTYTEDTPQDTWTVWFDTKEFKTRKTEVVSGGYTSTTEYSYGDVTISEPSPVEDMPDYSNMTPEQLQQQLQQLGQ